MVAAKSAGDRVWILPIVLGLAALMVLPGSAGLFAPAGHAPRAAAPASVAVAPPPPTPVSLLGSRISTPGLPSLNNPIAARESHALADRTVSTDSSLASLSAPAGTGSPAGVHDQNLSAELARINATFSKVPGSAAEAATARAIAEGVVPAQAAYVPNLQLVGRLASLPVAPTYNVSPAPMGLADLGLSSGGAYTISTPSVLGGLTLDAFNATAGSLYEDTGAYYWDGLSPTTSVTPWQSGLQLNTVLSNVSYPGSNDGSFWTQNVIDFSGDHLQFIDNVWNFSGPNAALNASTLYSYNGTWIVGDFYYDHGPVLPLTLPLTIDLYNNATVRDGRTAVLFGYRVTEGPTVYTGVYDTVVFNSQPSVSLPLLPPDYLVDGHARTPLGLLYDAELIFGGPGGGSNAVFSALNGTMALDYSLGGTWSPAPAAYDYGDDTGETSIGFAGTWQGATELVHQGPSLPYGLWNTSGGVPAGAFQLTVVNAPSWAFDFVGLSATSGANLSYMPTNTSGVGVTWLPPTLSYNLDSLADLFNPSSYPLTGASTALNAATTVSTLQGVNSSWWGAPIYLNGPAQARAFAVEATGWTSGAYVFSNLSVNVSLVFNHLNDWGFPEFDLFWAYGAGNPIVVYNVSQGPDSTGGICSAAGVPATCYLLEHPFGYENLPGYGSEIADWSDADPVFEDLLLSGWEAPIGVEVGGAVSLWNATGAVAIDLTSVSDSYGVWAASSAFVTEVDSVAIAGAVGLTLLDSPLPYAFNISSLLFATGVLDEGSPDGTYADLNATFLAAGLVGLLANDSEVVNLNAEFDSYGVFIEASSQVAVVYLLSNYGSIGVYGEGVANVTLAVADVTNGSAGAVLFGAVNTSLVFVYANDSEGGFLEYASQTFVTGVEAVNDSTGLYVVDGTGMTATYVTAEDESYGLYTYAVNAVQVSFVVANNSTGVEDAFGSGTPSGTTVGNVLVSNGAVGVVGYGASDLAVANVSVLSGPSPSSPNIGALFVGSSAVAATNVSATGSALGVVVFETYLAQVTDVSATQGAVGVFVQDSADVAVTEVDAASDGFFLYPTYGVDVNASVDLQLSDLSANGSAVGANLTGSFSVQATDVSAVNGAFGVAVQGSQGILVTDISAEDDSVGVFVVASSYVDVAGGSAVGGVDVRAFESDHLVLTNLTVSDPSFGGVELLDCAQVRVNDTVASSGTVGVLVEESQQIVVTNTTATGAGTVGVALLNTTDAFVNATSASDWAVGVGLADDSDVRVTGVTAHDPTSVSPWAAVAIDGLPITAVLTLDTDDTTVSDVRTTTYPLALYDNGSSNLFVQGLNASGGAFGVMLNGTEYALLDQAGAYEDGVGLEMNAGAFANVVTGSSFVADAGYGVDIASGSYNLIYDNDFVGDNGATAVYNATHIQAFSSSPTNAFNDTAEVGNYWADWHTYVDGVLAPYYVSSGAWDYHPLGAPEGTVPVTFSESGLPLGASWSVTLDGATRSSVGTEIVFDEYPGTYAFAVGVLTGWSISPASGSILVSSGALSVPVAFSQLDTVTFSESGLPASTSWSVVFNGVLESGSGSTLTFSVVGGTYAYAIVAPTGFAASPSSGSVTVGASYLVPVVFTSTTPPPPATYTVTIEESGLPSGTSWSAIFDGVEATSTTSTVTFTVTAGTYAYQVGSVAGYTVSPSSGSATVGGNYLISVAFTSTTPPAPPTYTVTIEESGLTSGTGWSAIFNGVDETTSAPSLTFTVTAGTYAYQVGSVAGYTVSPSSGSATIGGNYIIAVTYTSTTPPPPPTYTVTIEETGLPTGTSWSAIFDGVEATSTTSTTTFTVTAGTYAYQVGPVSGYTVTPSGGTATVGGNYVIAVTYAVPSTPSTSSSSVPTSTFNTDWAVAIGLAVFGTVVALVALLRRPRAPGPAAAWQEPGDQPSETEGSEAGRSQR